MSSAAEELEFLEALDRDQRENKLLYFKPFPYQETFFTAGRQFRERFFEGGNQTGKSVGGTFETACHLSGLYPDWWKGMRYNHPVKIWACGKSGQAVRDTVQEKLLGTPGVRSEQGKAMLPISRIVDTSRGRSATDAVDQVQIEHSVYEVKPGNYVQTPVIDGTSILTFKSYDQGPERFAGPTLDFLWMDEPPPQDVFGEAIARLSTANSRLLITATPLGALWLVKRFEDNESGDCFSLRASIDDRPDMTPTLLAQILSGYLPHEREARRLGLPYMDQGAVFPYSESLIKVPVISPLPPHWPRLWALDFGIGHAFAAVRLVWDRDTDTIYVTHCIKMTDSIPLQHAQAIKAVDPDAPITWPHDGTKRDHTSGIPLAGAYKSLGLKMLPTHATFKEGGYSFEGGLMLLINRMTSNRFKVFNTCSRWFEEFRYYHRDEQGLVVKKDDDLLSATRIGVMNIRSAREPGDGRFGMTAKPGPKTYLDPDAGDRYFGIDA